MSLPWSDLQPDDRLYILPLVPVFGATEGLALGGNSLRFLQLRIIVARGYKRIIDRCVSSKGVSALESALPAEQRARFKSLIAGFTVRRAPLKLPKIKKTLGFQKPLVMGIVNVTPDSFSDGGKFLEHGAAIDHALAMATEGADIIDIGGESTRPGAQPISEAEECDRVLPVIAALAKAQIPLSIDTRHARVMKAALQAGATIINDVSALTHDPAAFNAVVESNAPVVLMHAKGSPQTMQDSPDYQDVLLEVFDYLEARRDAAIQAGVDPSAIILDPGIGFGKRVIEDNLALIRGIAIFHGLGCPLLLGVSRKSFIGAVTGSKTPADRLGGSLAINLTAVGCGVHIIRVHDLRDTIQGVVMNQAILDSEKIDF